MKNDFIVCRCEDVYYKDIESYLSKENINSRELKLKTRAGMGFCNGRTCGPILDKITKAENYIEPLYIHLKSQPPIRTVTFDELSQMEDESND